ncbi:hypothetical protein JCM3775_007271 [Rhodotorula graminis]|uniref:Uncharacterized protein n=1 Tax=Rhodotorula graminis (strain WP1) TaxID=578459 RepID=A0A0P9H054_RHOGW|nr:uncharacterized protein RHOBADRAFT_46256 [Rhodotorula graminis WP1]KPV73151.1 hypothetical protein RHOBADRAFT_46256 [Rhodotorula graminis WP1]
MPPSDRTEPADGGSRLIDSDQLFIRLSLVYHWLQPAVEGRSIIPAVERAPASFERIWHDLLPDERERAVDILVSRFADLEAGVPRGWEMITFNAVKGAARRSSLHEHRQSTTRLGQLKSRIDAIARAAPPDEAEQAQSLNAYYFGPAGFTSAKLRRMKDFEWDFCSDELSKVLERVQTGEPISEALPAVDTILSRAHEAAQSPAERFAIFTRSIDDLLKVYQLRPLSNETQEGHLENLRAARETLLNEVEATSFVEHLHPDRQMAAARLARECLFHSCNEHMSGRPLPSLPKIIKELCNAVMVDIPQPHPHSRSDTQSAAPHPFAPSTTSAVFPPPPHYHMRSLGVSSRSPFFPISRRSAW